MQKDVDLEALLVELQAELRRRGGGLSGCLNPDEIEDAVQDATVELLQMIRSNQVHTSLKGLAHLIVRRKGCRCIAYQQRQQRLKEGCAQHFAAVHQHPIDPVKAFEREDEDEWVWRAVQQLDDLERLTVGLRYFGGYTYRAIAEVLGFDNEEAVNSCLRRARRQLRHLLTEDAA